MLPLYLALLAASFGLPFVPYRWLLYAAGGLGIAAALPPLFRKEVSAGAQTRFMAAFSFFFAVALNAAHPAVAYAALALWAARRVMAVAGIFKNAPLRRFAAGWGITFLALVWGGAFGFGAAALLGVVISFVSRIIAVRVAGGEAGMAGEGMAALLAGALLSLEVHNLAFLGSPLWGMAYGVGIGVFLYKVRLLHRFPAWYFALCATLIFMAAGREGFGFYFLFTVVYEAGIRMPRRFLAADEDTLRAQRTFNAVSTVAAVLALIAAGASDPFPYYFAIGGVFSAAVFGAWAGWGEYPLRAVPLGIWGAALLAICGWLTSFYPAGAAPVVMGAGLAAIAARWGRGIMSAPAHDQKWLECAFGAAAAVVLFRLLLPYLA